MTNIDTPDFQRGVVTPQQLVGSFAGGENNKRVTLPANTESILILCNGNNLSVLSTVAGVTTNTAYPWVDTSADNTISAQVFVAIVSPPADSVVEIDWVTPPSNPWFVVADSGVRIVNDAILDAIIGKYGVTQNGVGVLIGGRDLTNHFWPVRVSTHGVPYVTPQAPGTNSSSHPTSELSYATLGQSAGAVLVGQPGVGQRLRVFSVAINCNTAGAVARLSLTSGPDLTPYCYAVDAISMTYGPSGIPLGDNVGITLTMLGGGGPVGGATVVYTTETI